MLSRPCHIASHQGIAMTLDGRIEIHSQCHGLCVDVDKTVECGCECHTEQGSRLRKAVAASNAGGPLPPAVAVSAPPPPPARRDRPRARGRGPGRCQCGCGGTTGGRFVAGHDAKLKSQLWASALQGGYKDYAELKLRGWLKGKDLTKLPIETDTRGDAFAELHPDLVERRNEIRLGGTCSS